jgi:hypothetical protein
MVYTFLVLTPPEVESNWETIRVLLEPAVQFCLGDYVVEDFLEMVRGNEAFVCGVYEGGDLVLACVAQPVVYPRQTVMYILAVGGKRLDVSLDFFQDEIMAVARKLGAASIRGAARSAMERFYRRFCPMSHPVGVVMELKL